ncbi:MAG: imidazole glycerol phosphate synthase subunit HisF [Bacteroidales bacterium]|jgi:cyclase|nr:imidazole glycerol phosphate synthase subunit HisF [Bacteroidales bacterium]
MLKKSIIACLDIRDGRTVKGIRFTDIRDAGDPLQLADIHASAGADELVLLNISPGNENRKTFARCVERIAENINIPLTAGGGIESIKDAALLLEAGADRISVSSAAVRNPLLISGLADKFGSRSIIVAVDTNRIADEWIVFTSGGRVSSELKTVEWAVEAARLGAGAILLTSMLNDGTKSGYSIDITADVSRNVDIPVIASGGAGKMEHFKSVFLNTDCSAALAASIFHYGEIKIRELKEYLFREHIPVRL